MYHHHSARRHLTMRIQVTITYCVLVYLSTYAMKGRKNRLACARSFVLLHNASMCLISLVICVVGFTGAFLDNRFETIDTLICRPGEANYDFSRLALKGSLFASMIQLGDTFVSIANKKDLDVAHQLHHLTVIQCLITRQGDIACCFYLLVL